MNTTFLAKFTWATILLFFDLLVTPSLDMVYIVAAAISIDFATGIAKAKMRKQERTSEGYRRTMVKLLQYVVPIIVLWGGSTLISEYKENLEKFAGWLMLFVTYVEVTSIFENLYEIDKKSVIGKYLYKNVLKILKFGIENNPVNKIDVEDSKKDKDVTN